jgi:hypothetical protein
MIVDDLRETLDTHSVGVAVIYLNHKEADSQSPQNLLAALWRQLIIKKPLSSAICGQYEEHREQHTRPSLEDAAHILHSAILELSDVFIIVDAIDEYPEQERHILLRHLSSVAAVPGVQLMFTSRPHIDISHFIKEVRTLEIRAAEDDIRQYLDAKILSSSRLSRHVEKRPALREEIETTITRRSDGMCVIF